jgi:GNAT superfamily N-acetyltransferase
MTAFYHVRRARPSDRARILSLQPEILADGSLAGIDDAGIIEALLQEPAPDLDALIAAGRYFVAEMTGEQGGEIVAGAGWASHDALGDVAMIRAVCVHAAHRGTSIARRLVEIAEDAAVTEGHGVILAPVAATAAGVFEALGYLAAGHVEIELDAGRRLHRRKMWKHAA